MRTLNSYADCVVRRYGRETDQYLLHVADMDPAVARKTAVLVDTSCLSRANGNVGEMRANGLLFATAMADAVFRKKYAVQPALNAAALPPLVQPAYPDAEKWQVVISTERNSTKQVRLVQQFNLANAQGLQLRFGECVVRQDSDHAKTLLLANEVNERTAMAALSPALSTCFSGLGQARFNRHLLRAVIGLNYVRLALVRDAQLGQRR